MGSGKISAMQPDWEWLTKTIYDPAVFWAMVTAVATVLLVTATSLLVWVGVIPLVRNKQADLAERLRQDFLSSLAQNVLFLAAHNLLIFVSEPPRTGIEGMAFFQIQQMDGNIFQQRLVQIVGDQRIFMTFEIDDRILTPLEEVAFYVKDGELTFDDAFRVFGTYFDIIFSNREMQRYITWLRQRAPDAYMRAEQLYERMNIHNAETSHRG